MECRVLVCDTTAISKIQVFNLRFNLGLCVTAQGFDDGQILNTRKVEKYQAIWELEEEKSRKVERP